MRLELTLVSSLNGFYLVMDFYDQLIGLVGRVLTHGPGDLGSIPGCVIPKTLKMVLDTYLLNTQ